MKVIALYNIKGGVGKTAACVNLACLSAGSGMRTLLWDLDAQGASSYYLNVNPELSHGAKKLFKTRDIAKIAIETGISGLDIIPSDFSYRNMDLFLDGEKKPKKRMAEFISRFEDDYDVIFLDSPPSFSLVSENIFNAADLMLIPLIPTTLSMRTYFQILEYLDEHRKLPLRIMPFFSMVDRRKKLHLEIIDDARKSIPGVLKTVVPYLSIIESMGTRRAPVPVFAPRSDAAAIFDSLWTEIALRARIKRS